MFDKTNSLYRLYEEVINQKNMDVIYGELLWHKTHREKVQNGGR